MTLRDVDAVVIGGGVCGVLAAQALAEHGFTYKLVEKRAAFGGVWTYRANEYSHLQAHAALYQWHQRYKLSPFPFAKCSSSVVLRNLNKFAADFHIDEHTLFNHEVLDIARDGSLYRVTCSNAANTSGTATIRASAVMVCCGILGRQYSPEERGMKGIEKFSGMRMYAGRESDSENHLLPGGPASGKDVVILGSGAFGLEAMEAARRAGAKSITLLTRDRDRWIVPYSEQFKFIFISHAPFVPRYLKCLLMHRWLSALYRKSGLGHMAPAATTPQSFTGQCNDAFFQYAKRGIARFINGSVKDFKGTQISLQDGSRLHADVLVVALGHEVQRQPDFLRTLNLEYTTDLHNFAFLGKNATLAAASDWVWFNVPHGPQKQINSLIMSLKACRDGRAKDMKDALLPTPFAGCKGEPLNWRHMSGLEQRRLAYWRTSSAGLPWYGRAAVACRLAAQEWGTWLLCAGMYVYELYSLRGWLQKSV